MKKRDGHDTGMHRRRITLSDGRYLIFYTFDDGNAQPSSDKNVETAGAEPEVIPRAEEEGSV